ncbi:class I SAM-dependent methyltransferase [bacterium]|nr:class I SAM-dependent methyltransferase [bacterium]
MIYFKSEGLHPTYSKDYTEPKGAAHDNNGSTYFVEAIEKTFKGARINFLDLGCAGGALVKDMHDARHNAFGIEGSPNQKENSKHNWPLIPNNLFVADITEKFRFYTYDEDGQSNKVLFDVISAWDVLEHIPEERLPGLIANLVKNLKPDGFFICGIADFEDEGYHVTLHDKEWWIKFFEQHKMKLEQDEPQEIARKSSFHLKFKLME